MYIRALFLTLKDVKGWNRIAQRQYAMFVDRQLTAS
jgi:hypothetical protein